MWGKCWRALSLSSLELSHQLGTLNIPRGYSLLATERFVLLLWKKVHWSSPEADQLFHHIEQSTEFRTIMTHQLKECVMAYRAIEAFLTYQRNSWRGEITGRTTTFAPLLQASFTSDRALRRLAFLSAVVASCMSASLIGRKAAGTRLVIALWLTEELSRLRR